MLELIMQGIGNRQIALELGVADRARQEPREEHAPETSSQGIATPTAT